MLRFLSAAVVFAAVLGTSPPVFADPIPKPGKVKVKSLKGTKWEGLAFNVQIMFHILENGEIESTYSGLSKQNGTWKQDGAKVIFNFDSGVAIYEGKIENDVLKMDCRNNVGSTWTITLTPVKDK